MKLTLTKKLINTTSKIANSFEKCEAYWKRSGLNFTFRGVKFLLDRYGITFGQLRAAQFTGERGVYYCPEEATYYLIQAGLVSAKIITEQNIDELEQKTDELIADWMLNAGSLGFLFIIIMKQLEERHFFTSSAELEMIANTTELSDSLKIVASALTKQTLRDLTLENLVIGSLSENKPIKSFKQINEQH